jgi:pimeloyl-ACP methyl ester carboxylesterase
MAPFAGAKVTRPALFLGGDRDPALEIPGLREALERMPGHVTDLSGSVMLACCGYWVQQERPAAVNTALTEFLGRL